MRRLFAWAATLPPIQRAAYTALIERLLPSRTSSLEDLLALLRHPQADTRAAACHLLGVLHDKRAGAPLVRVLADNGECVDVRVWAGLALAGLYSRRARRVLIGLVRAGTPAAIRGVAIYALGQLGDSRAAPALTASLSDEREDIAVRAEAAEALGMLLMVGDRPVKNEPEVFLALRRGLRDKSAELRFWSAYALRSAKDPALLPILARMAQKDRGVVRGLTPETRSVAHEAQEAHDQIQANLRRTPDHPDGVS